MIQKKSRRKNVNKAKSFGQNSPRALRKKARNVPLWLATNKTLKEVTMFLRQMSKKVAKWVQRTRRRKRQQRKVKILVLVTATKRPEPALVKQNRRIKLKKNLQTRTKNRVGNRESPLSNKSNRIRLMEARKTSVRPSFYSARKKILKADRSHPLKLLTLRTWQMKLEFGLEKATKSPDMNTKQLN